MGFSPVTTSENPGYFDRKTKNQTNKNKNKASSPPRENSPQPFLHFPTHFKNELYENFGNFEPLHLPKKSVGFLLFYPTPTDRRKSLNFRVLPRGRVQQRAATVQSLSPPYLADSVLEALGAFRLAQIFGWKFRKLFFQSLPTRNLIG